MRAGCHIEVPREIATKRAVISVRTTDNACFAWSVVAALYPAEEHVYRESSYPHYTAVQKFEQLNDISINVYGIENKQILPLRLTSDKKEKHINLLYLQDPRDDNVGHFAWIKNLSRLVSSQLSKKEHKKFFCDRCLHYFGSRERLQSHTINCEKINDCAIRLPSEDDRWLEFNNHRNKECNPIIVKNCIKLRFIDSFKFLSASLDKLASYLDKDKLKITRSKFFNLSMKDFDLLTRKGVFPYEYIDCIEKLEETELHRANHFTVR
ncbi:hypothetical protein ALC57_18714 [Trachymyrmex cornetzi]|uniref:C2H2-type domain-containing protein n=1 Tax=Trachymyrmex cornetzi TaxID=471704 RepID=A0A151IRA3_9HYME|nr:hypothetical protein ALC57_18714 [Trachymyrmex cornetzi]